MEDQKQLLESIRDIMSGGSSMTKNNADNDDILDLTQVVNADGSISQIQPKVAVAPEPIFEPKAATPQIMPKPELVVNNEPKDVLSEIDALLAEPAPAAATEVFEPANIQIEPTPEPQIPAPELELREPAPVIIPEPVITTPEPEPEPAPAPVAIAPEPAPEPVFKTEIKEEPMSDTANLLSGDAANAAKSSISSMLEKLQKPKDQSITPFRSGETVENLVMEMMKPMLKEWLDTNLPPMVQSIVEREIKKILPSA